MAIQADARMADAKIDVRHMAVSNTDGTLKFNVENLSSDPKDGRKGMSSILKRGTGSLGVTEVDVGCVRLDTFLKGLGQLPTNIALWIDVEGAAYEVLEGIREIKEKISVIHIEVETREIWKGQKLEKDVISLMKEMGFVLLANGWEDVQRDLVFVNDGIMSANQPFILSTLKMVKVISLVRRAGGRTLRLIGLLK